MIQVNHCQISEQDVYHEMQYHPAESQREAMLKAAESLVIAELLRQRAKSIGLAVANDDDSTSDSDFIEELINREVKLPRATDEECQRYFDANQSRFKSSPLVEARHILIAADPANDAARAEAKLEAERIIIALQTGEPFEYLAERFSECPSKTLGGSLGQISKGQTVPEFERVMLVADVGLQLLPIESRYGFHVVEILRSIPGDQLDFELVKAQIGDYLYERVRRKALSQYVQTLIANAQIEGFDFSVPVSPLLQ